MHPGEKIATDGQVVDGISSVVKGAKHHTEYKVVILGRSQTLDLSAARRDLDYAPDVSILEGITEVIQNAVGSKQANTFREAVESGRYKII